MLGVWETRSRCSGMPLSAEVGTPLPPISRHGWSSYPSLVWKGGIPSLFKVWRRVSTWEYRVSQAHTLPLIIPHLNPSLMYVVKLSRMSLRWADTSAPSPKVSWNGRWAYFRRPLYPLFRKRRTRVYTEQYIIFPTPMTLPTTPRQSTRTLMVTNSPAPGAPSQLWCSSSLNSHPDLKHQYMMLRRHTG